MAHSVNRLNYCSGGQGIASACFNPLILLYLESFAIALSIYFSILGRKLERSNCGDMPISLGFLPELVPHDFPHSGVLALDSCFSPTAASVASPLFAHATPPYDFELDTPGTPPVTDDSTVPSSIQQEPVAVASDGNHNMKGLNYDRKQ
jgi:hypothetical protein